VINLSVYCMDCCLCYRGSVVISVVNTTNDVINLSVYCMDCCLCYRDSAVKQNIIIYKT